MKLSVLSLLLVIAGGIAAIPVEDAVEVSELETESALDEVTTFDADAGDVLVLSADDVYTPDDTDGRLEIAYENDGGTCGSTLTDSEIETIESQLTTDLAVFNAQSAATIASADAKRSAIPVVWHVIYSTKTVAGGYISNSAVKKSISAINTHFKGSGFGFTLKQIKRKKNSNWFKKIRIDPDNSKGMKTALHVGGAGTLNIYSVDFADGTIGYGTYPWAYSKNPKLDGVIIQYNSYPGGSLKNYNQGKTLTHEVGHWLGLYHVFQGGNCSGRGDLVADTPAQLTPTYGCPKSKNTCPQSGGDNIHNFMDYSYDKCLTKFTTGQINRARTVSNIHRF